MLPTVTSSRMCFQLTRPCSSSSCTLQHVRSILMHKHLICSPKRQKQPVPDLLSARSVACSNTPPCTTHLLLAGLSLPSQTTGLAPGVLSARAALNLISADCDACQPRLSQVRTTLDHSLVWPTLSLVASRISHLPKHITCSAANSGPC
jgi:hypothetical protein